MGQPTATTVWDRMPNDTDRPKKSLKERVEDLARDFLESLESLVTPEPELVPIPVRGRRSPYRR